MDDYLAEISRELYPDWGKKRPLTSRDIAILAAILIALMAVIALFVVIMGCTFFGMMDYFNPRGPQFLADGSWGKVGFYVGATIFGLYIAIQIIVFSVLGAIYVWPLTIILLLLGGFVWHGLGALIGYAISAVVGLFLAESGWGKSIFG